MSAITVNICFLNDGSKLVKERHSDGPVFSRKALIRSEWQTIHQWDDPGHVANLLVQSGYESEYVPAIKLLNSL